jgi:hypothetical protein
MRGQSGDRTTATRRLIYYIAIACLFFARNSCAQITLVPPFVGTHSETWEEFGGDLPDGTSIFGGLATISGTKMVTDSSFIMCILTGKPSDGLVLMDSDRPSGPFTISFSQPISAFGAYWGSGYHCSRCCGFDAAPSILTFYDVNGYVIGTDSFQYTKGKGKKGKSKGGRKANLMWRGYQFGTPVKTIVRVAGDGQEGFAIDGLQATVTSTTAGEPEVP